MRRLAPYSNVITLHDTLFEPARGRLSMVVDLMDGNLLEVMQAREGPPENCFVSGGDLKLGDFGSTRDLSARRPLTEYVATRWYRPPKCLLSNGAYGRCTLCHSGIATKSMEMLLRRRADCQCRNFEGYMALHLGCRVGGTDSLSSLITKSAKPYADVRTRVDAAPRRMSVRPSVVRPRPARVARRWTPLHYACGIADGQQIGSGARIDCVGLVMSHPRAKKSRGKSSNLMTSLSRKMIHRTKSLNLRTTTER
jgi:hypothetical protein